MYRSFIDQDVQVNSQIIIDEYKHIVNVLRKTPGDQLELVAKNGVFLCVIKSTDKEVLVEVLEEKSSSNESPIKISLYQALAKGDKFEHVIQKAVELGVTDIYPVETRRCVVKLEGSKKDKKIQRYRAIAEAAAKQSKRDFIPQVHDLINIKDIGGENLLIAYEKEGQGLKDALRSHGAKDISILIGPEGGLEEGEVQDLEAKGGQVINFGSRILRTETAGLFLISVIQFELGDMG